jgi:hypothetical protein
MPKHTDDDLDRPIWGAQRIGAAAGLVDENGNPDLARVYYLVRVGLLPVRKIGKTLVSTRRQLNAIAHEQ